MNELIKDNRHKIDTACQLCFFALDRLREAGAKFQEERRKIGQSMYIQEEKERMVAKAAEALASRSADEYAAIHENLETMRAASGEMAQLLDVGADLQNTLAIIKALGRLTPVEQRAALVEPFKGQMQALSLLRAAYEAADINHEQYFNGLIFDTSTRLDGLDDLAHRVTIQPQENLPAVLEFGRELERFASAMGVTLTSSFNDIVDTSGALSEAIRAAAGLGTAD